MLAALAARREIGVVADDHRIRAAELERHALGAPGRERGDALADRRRAGEGDLAHERVRDERLAGHRAACPGTTLSTPGGRPASVRISPRRSVVKRRRVGRLGHDRVAAQQRRAELVGTAASSGSSTARSRPRRRAAGAARARRRRGRGRARRRRGPAWPGPRSARACRPPCAARSSPRGSSCPARRRGSATSSSTCASKRLGARVQDRAAVGERAPRPLAVGGMR